MMPKKEFELFKVGQNGGAGVCVCAVCLFVNALPFTLISYI